MTGTDEADAGARVEQAPAAWNVRVSVCPLMLPFHQVPDRFCPLTGHFCPVSAHFCPLPVPINELPVHACPVLTQ